MIEEIEKMSDIISNHIQQAVYFGAKTYKIDPNNEEIDLYVNGLIVAFSGVCASSMGYEQESSFNLSLIVSIIGKILDKDSAEEQFNFIDSLMVNEEKPESFTIGLDYGEEAAKQLFEDYDPGRSRVTIIDGMEDV